MWAEIKKGFFWTAGVLLAIGTILSLSSNDTGTELIFIGFGCAGVGGLAHLFDRNQK